MAATAEVTPSPLNRPDDPAEWPIGDFDYKTDEALDIVLNYLEYTGQAVNIIEVQRAAAVAIVTAWKTGVRHRIKLAHVAIKAVEQKPAPQIRGSISVA